MDAATVINAATRTPGRSSGHLLMMVGRQLMLGGFGTQGRWSQDGKIGTPTELMEDLIILTRRNELGGFGSQGRWSQDGQSGVTTPRRNELMEELVLRMIGVDIALSVLCPRSEANRLISD